MLRKYRIDAILIPPPDNSAVHQFLVSHPEFALVYFDEAAFVYARRTPNNIAFIQSNEYRFLTPQLQNIDQNADQFIFEAKRAITQNPSTFMPYFVLGLAYESKGERRLAKEVYLKAESLNPKSKYQPLGEALKRIESP
jgi:cytochrome c-type biogenesis protein CcmH/NrfG